MTYALATRPLLPLSQQKQMNQSMNTDKFHWLSGHASARQAATQMQSAAAIPQRLKPPAFRTLPTK